MNYNPREPFGLPAMDKMVDMIMEVKGTIVVNFDYDADGCIGGSLAVYGLQQLGYTVHSLANNRRWGNGYNAEMHKEVLRINPEMLLTVDHGSGSDDISRYEELKAKGVKIGVTDHHSITPRTAEVVDVFVNSMSLPDTHEMNGAYLAFELIKALDKRKGNTLLNRGTIDHMLPYVATTLISDVMSLQPDYTKDTYYLGLHIGRTNPSVLFRELSTCISEDSIVFEIAPVINSFGRTGVNKEGSELIVADLELSDVITTKDKTSMVDKYLTLQTLIAKARRLNNKRKALTIELAEGLPDLNDGTFGKIASVGGHEGLIGIIASKLTDRYDEPSIVISKENGKAVLSCRGVYGFDILSTLQEVQRTTGIFTDHKGAVKFGGHKEACGGSIPALPNDTLATLSIDDRIKLFIQEWKKVMSTKQLDKRVNGIMPYPDELESKLLIDVLNSANGKNRKQKYRLTGSIKLIQKGIHLEVIVDDMRCFMFNGAKHADSKPKAVIVELGVNSWSFWLNRTVVGLEF